MVDMPTWGMWVILAALLLMRGLVAAMEAALQALADHHVKELARGGSTRAQRVVRW